ncbi:MAG: hypothetical protein PHI85_00115 [Victivallaceae bacterium]|nr:hypothetical protein [Victivallaceae bacterium]
MSRKSLDEFAMRLACTPEWVELSRQRQNGSADRAEFVAWLCNFAAEQGYEVTAEDVENMNREYNGK